MRCARSLFALIEGLPTEAWIAVLVAVALAALAVDRWGAR